MPEHAGLMLVLRQSVGDVVIIAFVGDEDWIASWVPVGASNAPIATPILSLPIGSHSSAEPQIEQKPRRTRSDDWNQVSLSSPSMVKEARGTSVDAQ